MDCVCALWWTVISPGWLMVLAILYIPYKMQKCHKHFVRTVALTSFQTKQAVLEKHHLGLKIFVLLLLRYGCSLSCWLCILQCSMLRGNLFHILGYRKQWDANRGHYLSLNMCAVCGWMEVDKGMLIILRYLCVYAFTPVCSVFSCVALYFYGAFACVFEFYLQI